MSGKIIPVMSRRTLDMSSTAFGPPIEITLMKVVDVSAFTEGELYVRVHGGTIGGNGVINILAYTTLPSAEDPSVDFVRTGVVANASLTASSTAAAPTLVRAVLSSSFGGALSIHGTGNTR